MLDRHGDIGETMSQPHYGQREFMRALVGMLGHDQYEVCTAYAEAEWGGQVPRKNNADARTPEEYATALWRDAQQKGWL